MTNPLKNFSLILVLSYSQFCLASQSIGLPPPDAPLSLLVYKMEVLNYCGLIDNNINRRFKQRRDQIIASDMLSVEEIQNARLEGWKFGLAEWQNRGLGGFKNWCKTDGREIVEYFYKIDIPVD